MLNNFMIGVVMATLTASTLFGAQGVKFYVGEGNKEFQFMNMVDDKISKVGFILSGSNEHIENAYKTKWGMKTQIIKGETVNHPDFDPTFKENLDNLGFFSISNDVAVGPLLMKEPSLGGFTPFNFHIYKTKKDNKTFIGHVTPETMLDVVGIKDKDVRKAFADSFVVLDKTIQEEIGGEIKYIDYEGLPAKTMMTFEMPVDRSIAMADFKMAFQERFEAAFEQKKYIIAGYKDIKEAMETANVKFDRFDEYWVYSLCHFRFSESIFNRGRPDAGAFAPCSMYMYIDKESNKMIVGMPRLETWNAVMNFKDKAMVESTKTLDKEIISIMKELGAKEL